MSSFTGSRFANPNATAVADLGECRCPGTPHERDEAVYRTQLGASALARVGRAELEGAVRQDPLAAHRQLVVEAVISWNLLWPDPTAGEDVPAVAVPINEATVELLDASIITLANLIDEAAGGSPPNASSARSRASSRASASRTPTTTRKRGT